MMMVVVLTVNIPGGRIVAVRFTIPSAVEVVAVVIVAVVVIVSAVIVVTRFAASAIVVSAPVVVVGLIPVRRECIVVTDADDTDGGGRAVVGPVGIDRDDTRRNAHGACGQKRQEETLGCVHGVAGVEDLWQSGPHSA